MGFERPENITIRTERLTLRPRRNEDADALHGSFSDPGVMKYWNRPPTTSLEETRAYVAEKLAKNAEFCCSWAVECENRIAGTVDLFNWRDRIMEVGYLIDKSHQGKGFAYEAVRAALDFGFDKLNLHRIEAQLHPENAASRSLLEKLGFQREGLMRQNYCIDGRYSDTLVYGLLASDPRP